VSVYRGIVKGKTVVLPADAQLAEGSVVEIRVITTELESATDDVGDQAVQAALVTTGILRRMQPLGAKSAVTERPLLRVEGPPVSETIISERR
jgi:hypothetical protein